MLKVINFEKTILKREFIYCKSLIEKSDKSKVTRREISRLCSRPLACKSLSSLCILNHRFIIFSFVIFSKKSEVFCLAYFLKQILLLNAIRFCITLLEEPTVCHSKV